ncbi:MAG: alpha/beta family hydrolase [Acidobacteriota bacterium]
MAGLPKNGLPKSGSPPTRLEQAGVAGFLHSPAGGPIAALAITHGAGSNCQTPLLLALAEAFADAGYTVLRYDLPFRQARPHGPPLGSQAKDRDGIRRAADALRSVAPNVPLYLSGHSYGGRQTSMLAAEDASAADAILLLSYPLHPPKQPDKLRTQHFPQLQVPALFVHGTRDEFGTISEMESARLLIPARTAIQPVQGAPHGLAAKLAPQVREWFVTFTSK